MASLLVLGAFGIASCDDNDIPPDATPPTVEVVGEASKQALIEADSTLKFTVSVNAPEGFDSLEITSDRGFSDDSTTSDVNSFDVDLDIDVSSKEPGAEVFTFKVTDALGQTDTVNVTATYRLAALSYSVTLGNAVDPMQMDGISQTNIAFLSLNSGLSFARDDIEADLDLVNTTDVSAVYVQTDENPRLVETAAEGIQDIAFWEGNKFTIEYRNIDQATYDAIAAATGLDQVIAIDEAFANGTPGSDVLTSVKAYQISTGETGVFTTEAGAGNVNSGDGLVDNEFTFNVITNRNK
ncbi:MAG: hypothetical protein H7A32_05665 [Deltaproteobacteria bacterium]|nr:hypothetical protein [Deltaproteobacteria bacterium]